MFGTEYTCVPPYPSSSSAMAAPTTPAVTAVVTVIAADRGAFDSKA